MRGCSGWQRPRSFAGDDGALEKCKFVSQRAFTEHCSIVFHKGGQKFENKSIMEKRILPVEVDSESSGKKNHDDEHCD